MKKTMALLLALMLVLSCLGTVAFAADAPVITGGYIGGLPVAGEYVHVIVDGTYGGVAFEKAITDGVYSVTATYEWAYGEGEEWTPITATYFTGSNRACKVTEDMVGKYIRCTVTPTDGTTEGDPEIFTFPTKIMAAEDAKWKETTLYSEEFSGSAPVGMTAGTDKADFAIENGAWKMTNWNKDTANWQQEENGGTYDGQYGNLDGAKKGPRVNLFRMDNQITVKPDYIYTISYDMWSDAGTAKNFQFALENWTYLIMSSHTTSDAFRGGEYNGNVAASTTKKTYTDKIPVLQVINKSAYPAPDKKAGITTSAMQYTAGSTRTPYLMIPDNGTVFTGGITAVYLDNIKVVEKALLYDVTITSGGETVDTIEVESGTSKEIVLPKPAGKIIKSVTVNGVDADIANGMISLPMVHQNYTVDVTYEDITIDHISLENNKVHYTGEDRAAEQMKLTAYDENGSAADITGLPGITYETSDSSVFTVDGDKVASTGKTGKATITAKYDGMEASVMMIYQPATMTGQDDLAESAEAVKVESNLPSGYKITEGLPGHNDSVSYSAGTEKVCKPSGIRWGVFDLRHYAGRTNWYDLGYKSFSGWFYDDGVNPAGIMAEIKDAVNYSGSTINADLVEDMSYGEFASVWENAKGWEANNSYTKVVATAGSTVYTTPNGTIPRTAGWHQASFEIVKNPASPSGWAVDTYLDGKKVGSCNVTVVTNSDPEPHAEIRALVTQTGESEVVTAGTKEDGSDTIYRYSLYPSYYDDFVMGGALTEDIVGIKTSVTGNGTVTIEGATEGTNGWKYVTAGSDVTVSLKADSGRGVKSATYNGQTLTPDENGTVTLTDVTEEGTLDVVFAATYDTADIKRITLENNVVYYIGTDRAEETIKLTAYDADNKAFDVTGLEGVTYESSDSSVFTVNGNKVKSNGVNGKAIITAKYGDLTASVVMVRQPAALDGTSEFAGKTFAVMDESGINGSLKYTDMAGHDGDGEVWTWGTSATASAWTQSWNYRRYAGRYNWWDRGYRSVSGWFYDDGTNPVSMYLESMICTDTNDKYKDTSIAADWDAANADMVEDMSYGEFGDKLKDVVIMKGCSRLKAALNATDYTLTGTANGDVTVAPRTVGWHQITYSIAKNPNVAYGWCYKVYLDGVELEEIIPIVPSTKENEKDPHIEIRAVATVKEKNATTGDVTLYPFYIDDLYVGGNLEADIAGINYQITGNGSVKVDGAAKENGTWSYVTAGESVDVTLEPGSNYEISSVTLDGQALTPNNNNVVTLSNVTKDSVLAVTYTEKPPVDPAIVPDVSYSWFKTVNGVPTVYAYSKLNEFNTGGSLEYGMKLWIKGAAEHVLTLPARDGETGEPAVAAPGTAFGIKAYGDAITVNNTYVMKPYVGTAEGDELEAPHTAE